MVRTMQLEAFSKMNNGHGPLTTVLSFSHSYGTPHSPNIDLRALDLYNKTHDAINGRRKVYFTVTIVLSLNFPATILDCLTGFHPFHSATSFPPI